MAAARDKGMRWQAWIPAGRRGRLLVVIALIALLFLLCALSYQLGFRQGHGIKEVWLVELEQLRQRSNRYDDQIEALSQELINLRQGARIDRESAEQVREEVVASEAKIAALEEDLTFYRGLMTPTDTEQGLGIRSFALYPAAVGQDQFRYELVLQQLALKHNLLRGSFSMEVLGQREGEPASFSYQELLPAGAEAARDFRFRYFQKIEGILVLPAGFSPDAVAVTAHTREKRPQKVARDFEWRVMQP